MARENRTDEEDLDAWASQIIGEVKSACQRYGGVPLEFSIFYSPLRVNPRLMIIGDNPGGQMGQPGLYDIPKIHEYINLDPENRYLMASIMRDKVLCGVKLSKLLSESVKTNRVFFRTPDLATLNNIAGGDWIVGFCMTYLIQIIEKIRPQSILAESFGTFRSLSNQEQVLLIKPGSPKALLLRGQYKGIPVYGINHPSRASFHRITDADWKLVNNELERLL